MANSYLNKHIMRVATTSPVMATAISGASAIATLASRAVETWIPISQAISCVERPQPPAEEDLPEDPVVEEPTEEELLAVSDQNIPADDRERPGITSKTTSVGRKVVMIDHQSFYSYNPNNAFQAIPWSPGMDPVRFLLGRLWTQYPADHQLGTRSDLYGKSVIFGHKIMPEGDDWARRGDKAFRVFKDPVKVRDLRSGASREMFPNPVSAKRDPVYEEYSGNTSIVRTVPREGREDRYQEYDDLLNDLEAGNRPMFSDLAEFGLVDLVMDPSAFSAEGGKASHFRRLVFGGMRDPMGRVQAPHTFRRELANSTISTSGGLFSTISRQQTSYGTYSDHSYEYSSPISSVNVERYANISRPLHAKISPVYNHYCAEYEALTASVRESSLPSYTLPNIYSLATEKGSTKLDHEISPSVTNFLRLNPTLTRRDESGHHPEDRVHNFLIDKLDSAGKKISEKSTGLSYFKKWTSAATEMVNAGIFGSYAQVHQAYSKQVFPYSEDSLYFKVAGIKRSFPMYCEITFSIDSTSKFAESIASANLDCYLAEYLLDARPPPRDEDRTPLPPAHMLDGVASFVEAQQYSLQSADSNLQIVSRLFPNITTSSSYAGAGGRRCYDLEEWIRSIGRTPQTQIPKMVFGESQSAELLDMDNPDAQALLRVYLASKVRKLIKEESKFRTLPQVFNGKLCYNEALMYKVEKYLISSDGSEDLVSEYLIPNRSNSSVAEFIDTQVAYEKRYVYKIKVISLVIGNEYFYIFPAAMAEANSQRRRLRHIQRSLENNNSCRLEYCNYPSAKIIESPYYNDTMDNVIVTRVMDSPPVPPLVRIEATKGRADRVLVLLNAGTGDFVQQPIVLRPDVDTPILGKIRESQAETMASIERNDLSGPNPVRFKNDDMIRKFEIYRIDFAPSSYIDFQNSLYATIDTGGRQNSGSLYSMLSPNRKYYYTFRAVDSHGYFSNPTPIYEVEMVEDGSVIYPIIKMFDPSEIEPPKEKIKILNRFLEITPKADHLKLNFPLSGLDSEKNRFPDPDRPNSVVTSVFPHRRSDFNEGNQFVLGSAADPDLCWGRRFKIRISSKESGRKLDLNVTFKYNDLVKASDFYYNEE